MNKPIDLQDQPIDEQSLQEYLQRRSEYSSRYRELAANDVPMELDRAVLAEATAAIAVKPRLQTWRRFSVPVALAATVVIAVSIALQSGQESKFETGGQTSEAQLAPQSSTPAPATEPAEFQFSAPDSPPPAKVNVSSDKRRAREELVVRQKAESKQEAGFQEAELEKATRTADVAAARAPSPAAAPSSAPPATELDRVVVTGALRQSTPQDAALPVEVITAEDRSEPSRAGPRNTVQSGAGTASRSGTTELEEIVVTAQQRRGANAGGGPRGNVLPAGSAEGLSDKERIAERESDPRQWLEYIRELRAASRNVEANREWQRFVKANPNYPVAQDDVARPKK